MNIGNVFFAVSVNIIEGVYKLFHDVMKAKIACVAIAGFIKGNAILLNVENSPEPSILAASISEGGITESTYCLKKNTVPGEAIAGIINGI